MELTNELLYQFRALYWGQNVLCSEYFDWTNERVNIRTITVMNGNIYMSLRPLSSITEEEARDIHELHKLNPILFEKQDIIDLLKRLFEDGYTRHYVVVLIQLVDYLRSKGFLLDAFGIPSDQWVEWGVVKLKTE